MTKKGRRRRSKEKEARALLWATAVVGSAELPDARLGQRAVAILAQKAARPGDSIAQGAPDPAAAKGYYRFVENESVKPEPLWKAVHEQTAKGLAETPRVVSVQDTVCLMFPGLRCTKGLGTADQPREEALWMHSALALRPDGHVLGLVHNHVWARPLAEFGKGHQAKKRPFEEKESFEPRPPKGVEALDWLLFTTLPIGTAADRAEVVRLYKLRWRIEEFHLALKSGCRIEKTQMKTAERIKILLPFFCAVAARLVQLTYWARTEPHAACTVALSDLEWRVAWQFTHKRRVPAGTPVPTIAEAVMMIGRMGGHLGRKGDGMPGLRSLWKGWRDLQLLADYHRTFR
ncbi:MAG: IS4 family transposase [Acidobacteria bacterium]|nr:IS4 family transposase [Acidobacteriota bacterium]